jgi:hypothetical protein
MKEESIESDYTTEKKIADTVMNETIENREQQAYTSANCKQSFPISFAPFEIVAIVAIIVFFWRR